MFAVWCLLLFVVGRVLKVAWCVLVVDVCCSLLLCVGCSLVCGFGCCVMLFGVVR